MTRFDIVDFETIKEKWIYGYWHMPAAFTWEQKPIKLLFTFQDVDHKLKGVVFLWSRFDKNANSYMVDMDSTRWANQSDLSVDTNIEDSVVKACEAAEVIYHHNMKKRDVIRSLQEKPRDAT